MQLSIVNTTGSTKTYLSGAVSVLANSTLAITSSVQQISLSADGALAADVTSGAVNISDGTTIYGSSDAIFYLQLMPRFFVPVADTSGNGITSTLNNGKQSLDVNMTNTAIPTELLNGQLFSTSVEANAATSGADNPLLLFRNPVGSGKTCFIKRILVGVEIVNIPTTFKVYGRPTLTNTVATITNITQGALSTTVTVTTSAANGATVGATVVISGTTNFNGTFTVASVTSTTIYTFTKTAGTGNTNTSGTSTMNSSLGTAMSAFPMKRVASPTAAIALVTSLPTVPSNGDQLMAVAQGQNSAAFALVDSDLISLEPGQNLLLTGSPNSNNRLMTVTIIWSEL